MEGMLEVLLIIIKSELFYGAKCFPCMVFSNSVFDVDNCSPVLPKSRKSEMHCWLFMRNISYSQDI